MNQDRLHKLVSEFRAAIEHLANSGHWFDVSITNAFPFASCDDSSQLLAAYLADHGFPGAIRVSGSSGGRNNELSSHVWLSLGGVLIDITGSQFEDYCQPDILISEKDDFLSTFEVDDESRVADFRKVPLLPQHEFHKTYDAIVKTLSSLK